MENLGGTAETLRFRPDCWDEDAFFSSQNKIDRFNIVKLVLAKLGRTEKKYTDLNKKMDELLSKHNQYVRKYGQDIPEVRNWKWRPAKNKNK